ncbi:mitochondrial substrate carrier family protein [Klebsormidium nitens]|uniref:Mitochondrial substrate carrier family protein n=1 Tax=Klebsormidium nitens TaxID=105231 RepID=A0A1Y1I466_KLENI|nr:mitochondrial substrate carrier family protein [Klebsormidium nitens]|eukprot:GAQ82898.1 mitochondrial substrate carrier family protein [Klebsormidium nitens]
MGQVQPANINAPFWPVSGVACLSSSLPGRSLEDIRAVFNEIDKNQDGKLTESELVAFAAERGLPTTYVKEFLEAAGVSHAVDLHTALAGLVKNLRKPLRWPGIQRKNAEKSWLQSRRVPFLSQPRTVDFDAFQSFVQSKDAAIEQAFRALDRDGNGEITRQELEDGIRHVRVICGGEKEEGDSTVFRPKIVCAQKMIRLMAKEEKQTISYREFRDFFTLLPKSSYLMDYWLSASCCRVVDLGYNVEMLSKDAESAATPAGSPWNHLVAGGLAGAVSRTVSAPLETIRLQMMIKSSSDMGAAAKDIVKGGWPAFFKGNLTNVIRAVPQKAIDFFAFEAYKMLLNGDSQKPVSNAQVLMAGALAGATSTLILYPLDVVRSRQTVQAVPKYKNLVHALHSIATEEGAGALYKGLRPSIVAIIPEAAITYGAFDILKKGYRKLAKVEEVPVPAALFCGVSSALMGQIVAFPLELVSRRLQVQVAGPGGAVLYTGMTDAFAHILRTEGISGLYRGLAPASLKILPMASVSFGVYELSRHLLSEAAQAQQKRRFEKASLEAEKKRRAKIIFNEGEGEKDGVTSGLKVASEVGPTGR